MRERTEVSPEDRAAWDVLKKARPAPAPAVFEPTADPTPTPTAQPSPLAEHTPQESIKSEHSQPITVEPPAILKSDKPHVLTQSDVAQMNRYTEQRTATAISAAMSSLKKATESLPTPQKSPTP